jgi:hypothetical protein
MLKSDPFAIVKKLHAKGDWPARRQLDLMMLDIFGPTVGYQIVHHLFENGVSQVALDCVATVIS